MTADRSSGLARLARGWVRYEPLLLLLVPAAVALVVFAGNYATDPDSYFHLGCARRIFTGGCLRSLPELPYTTLADPFPNFYLGQHLLLAPLASLLPATLALQVAAVALSSGLALSLFLVLRRHGVARPAPWIALGLLAIPQTFVYAIYVKGAATFLVLLVWFVDAVWAGRTRRVLLLAWISVYVYLGATVLVPFVAVHVAVTGATSGRWPWRLLAATALGLLGGLIVNPGWPAHWMHLIAELRTIIEQDPRLVPGDLRGAEWAPLAASQLISLAGAALGAWAIIFVRRMSRAEPVAATAIGGAVAALGLLGAAMFAGTKMLELFAVFSLLAVPIAAGSVRWPRWTGPAAAAVGLLLAGRTMVRITSEMDRPGLTHPADYRQLGQWLDARVDPGEIVVVPWYDMPGVFDYADRPRYVAGWNVQFLLDGDERRFNGYYLLFEGQVADPEKLLPALFEGARYLILPRQPRTPGEAVLLEQIGKNRGFEEVAGPVPVWRVFRVRT